MRKSTDLIFFNLKCSIYGVVIVKIPASSLELASEKRTELVERLAEIDDEIIYLFLNEELPLHSVPRCRDQWPASFLSAHGIVRCNDRRLLIAPEVGSLIITATQINTLIQFRPFDYGMENCSLVLHFPEYGSEAMMEIRSVESSMIDVWSLALDDKVDLQRLLYRSLPRRIDKVGSFTQTYNTAEQLSSFTCESGTYHGFLWACPQGARKEDVGSTNEKPIGAWIISPLGICSSMRALTPGLYLVQQQTIRSSPKIVLRRMLELGPNSGTSTVRTTNFITYRCTEWTGPSPTKGHIIVTQ